MSKTKTGVKAGTVLIVEDELMILTIAREEFKDAGYEVVVATDADAALKVLEANRDIDVLFTDIRMPGTLDGWALARNARQIRPSLPVIYATGFSQDAPQPVDGALLFMKPYRLSTIIEAARSLHAPG